MKTLRLILGDQLNLEMSSLQKIDKKNDIVMLCEVKREATYVKHHKQKIAFLFSAMRHFASELNFQGFNVRYIKLDDKDNTGNFTDEVARAVKELNIARVIVTEPGEYRVLKEFNTWEEKLKIRVDILVDTRFFCSLNNFKLWAKGKKQLRMEFFYREMRKTHGLLIDVNGEPAGGIWNYDKQNRQSPTKNMHFPKRLTQEKTTITKNILHLVTEKFFDHFGSLEKFDYAVTREQALQELKHFIKYLLPNFGNYQDAMLAAQPYLYHSRLSAYLNAGLLLPREICQLAETAYRKNKVPINAAEGFIRQILGWREYVRGIYWLYMPNYAQENYFAADKQLPDFYWGSPTNMYCIAEVVRQTYDHAYSHHIQRLMITGNFALLAGINPLNVCEWYLEVYADAYEWVELPNTLGMALFGDGGLMASKPYAASGKYIKRMSNFCKNCSYNPDEVVGENACPFNSLYWDFLSRNQKKLRNNQRMNYAYANWDKMTDEKKFAIHRQAKLILSKMQLQKL